MNNKYRAIKTEVDGIKFDSKKEAKRYIELKYMEEHGEISNLRRQVKYILIPKNDKFRECSYKADFVYIQNGEEIVEDVKGVKSKEFKIKEKLFYHIFKKNIKIT